MTEEKKGSKQHQPAPTASTFPKPNKKVSAAAIEISSESELEEVPWDYSPPPIKHEINTDDNETTLSEPEIGTINCYAEPDEPARSVGFDQHTEVRFYPCKSVGNRKPSLKRKKREEWYPQKVKKLEDMLCAVPSLSKKTRIENKLKVLKDTSVRVLKLNQEMEEALQSEEEPPPLIDYSTEQAKAEQHIRNDTYLIRAAGIFKRRSLLDKDVNPPPPCISTETRYCEYCSVSVDLHVWLDHINSTYHILMGKIKRQLLFRCWRGKRYEKPHDWRSCEICKKRISEMRDDGPPFHDIEFYSETEDIESLEACKAHTFSVKAGASKGDIFYCEQCEVRCTSRDFFEKHIKGWKHRQHTASRTNDRKATNDKNATGSKQQKLDSSSLKRKGAAVESPSPKKRKSNVAAPTETKSNKDPSYCEICDMNLSNKKNMARHKKTIRHRNNAKARMTAQGEDVEETVTGKTDLNERGFAVTGSEKHPGKIFFLTINAPIKYKIAKRLNRRMYQCTDCLKRFRSSGFLRRHKMDKIHKFIHKRRELTVTEKKWKRLIDRLMFNNNVQIRKSRLSRIRELRLKQTKVVKMAVMCNEFTPVTVTDPFPLSHCHAYIVTHEKMLFREVKRYFKKTLRIKSNINIERPLNFRETARYCTKHDRQAIVLNVPMKFTSTAWRAAVYARDHKQVNWGDEIPSSIALCDQKIFKGVVGDENRISENQIICIRTNKDLNPWQNQLLTMLNEDKQSRIVFWVVDQVGGGGKSFFFPVSNQGRPRHNL